MNAEVKESAAPVTSFDVLEGIAIELRLNSVDYTIPADYVPSNFALTFVAFIKLVNGEGGEENKTPIVHYYMLDTLVSGSKRIANLCHRGLAKTTLFGEYLILYLAVYAELPGFGVVDLALYVSDSIENGVKNMRKNLEFRWDDSEFLQEFVPKTRFTDVRWEFENADGKRLVVRGYGAKTGVRGTKEMGRRPQLAILDDLISDEDARSATVIAAVEDTVYKAVEYALHPAQNMMIWSGTPFNARDPLYKAVESGAWAVNVFPVCESFPCSEEDFRGSWPDRFTYQYVKKQYEKAKQLGKIDTFDQELMLRIMSDDDRVVLDTDILWYDSPQVMLNRGRFNFYITTDFAASVKKKADYSVISVWAYNSAGAWLWVDGFVGRQTMDRNVDMLFQYSSEYRPQSVGIEVSGQQVAFIPWIQREMIERNVWFSIASEGNSGAPGIRPTTDKLERFNLILPMIKSQRIFFPADKKDTFPMIEAMEELRLVSVGGFRSKQDDFLDSMSQLASLTPWKPSETGDMSRRDEGGVWGFDEEDDDEHALGSYIV